MTRRRTAVKKISEEEDSSDDEEEDLDVNTLIPGYAQWVDNRIKEMMEGMCGETKKEEDPNTNILCPLQIIEPEEPIQ